MREIKKPTKVDRKNVFDGDTFEHQAFGAIQVFRVSGDATLFQSELKHQHYIRLCVNRASVDRSLHRDRIYAEKETIVEVSMSEAQWASLVSSIGMGSGTPCTIERAPASGTRIERMPSIDPLNKIEMFIKEAGEDEIANKERADFILRQIDQMLAGKTIKKSQLNDLHSLLESVLKTSKANAEFAKDQFTEHVENTVAAAKSEVEGHVLHLVQQHGLESIKRDVGLLK